MNVNGPMVFLAAFGGTVAFVALACVAVAFVKRVWHALPPRKPKPDILVESVLSLKRDVEEASSSLKTLNEVSYVRDRTLEKSVHKLEDGLASSLAKIEAVEARVQSIAMLKTSDIVASGLQEQLATHDRRIAESATNVHTALRNHAGVIEDMIKRVKNLEETKSTPRTWRNYCVNCGTEHVRSEGSPLPGHCQSCRYQLAPWAMS